MSSSHLYWAADNSGAGQIMEANLDGSNPQAIVNVQGLPGRRVAVDSSHLYWGGGDGTIWEANPDGSNPHLIDSSESFPAGVAVGPQ